MKSDHRHELKENELGKATQQARMVIERHGNQILLGILAALVVIGGVMWWSSSSRASSAAGWSAFYVAQSAEDFANVSEKFPKTAVAQWSKINESEMYLFDGLRLAFTDRTAGVKELKKAREGFEAVLAGTPLADDMRERALYGLARTLEVSSGSDTKPAIDVYEQLVRAFPNSPLKPECEQRIAELKRGGSQEFYGWFQAQNPKPEDIKRPSDGLPSGHSPVDLEKLLQDAKDSSNTPESPADGEAPKDPPSDKPAAPTSDKPSDAPSTETDKEKPADSPADPSKPSDKPAADDKPADPKPESPAKPETDKPAAKPE